MHTEWYLAGIWSFAYPGVTLKRISGGSREGARRCPPPLSWPIKKKRQKRKKERKALGWGTVTALHVTSTATFLCVTVHWGRRTGSALIAVDQSWRRPWCIDGDRPWYASQNQKRLKNGSWATLKLKKFPARTSALVRASPSLKSWIRHWWTQSIRMQQLQMEQEVKQDLFYRHVEISEQI